MDARSQVHTPQNRRISGACENDDDGIAPHVAMKLLEPLAAVLRNIPAEDRHAVAALIAECAGAGPAIYLL